jgi:hypothetical protein
MATNPTTDDAVVTGLQTPCNELTSLKNDVTEAIARETSCRKASTEMDAEQVSRIQQHTFETEVGPSLVRAVNVATADAAACLEQGQRISEHVIRNEVTDATGSPSPSPHLIAARRRHRVPIYGLAILVWLLCVVGLLPCDRLETG